MYENEEILTLLDVIVSTVFITGCPVDEDDLFGGTVTITNSSGNMMNEIAIDENCTGSWDGIAAISLGAGATGSYDVSGSIAVDTYDVRVCNVGLDTCFDWYDLGPGDDTVDTATPNLAGTRQASC